MTRATLDVVTTDPGTRLLSREMMLEAEKIARQMGRVSGIYPTFPDEVREDFESKVD